MSTYRNIEIKPTGEPYYQFTVTVDSEKPRFFWHENEAKAFIDWHLDGGIERGPAYTNPYVV
jgi:hypothetical protein